MDRQSRRRGETLLRAIYEATIGELNDVGYARLTMEQVACRSGTSKASLYRRWPSRIDLVVDAVHALVPEPQPPDAGSVRDDLYGYLRRIADRWAGPAGEAKRGVMIDTLTDPTLMQSVRERLAGSRPQTVAAILQRGAERGEVRADAVTDTVSGVGVALLSHHFLIHGSPVPDDVIAEIVDAVVMPLVHT